MSNFKKLCERILNTYDLTGQKLKPYYVPKRKPVKKDTQDMENVAGAVRSYHIAKEFGIKLALSKEQPKDEPKSIKVYHDGEVYIIKTKLKQWKDIGDKKKIRKFFSNMLKEIEAGKYKPTGDKPKSNITNPYAPWGGKKNFDAGRGLGT